jgi:hypothetical protein
MQQAVVFVRRLSVFAAGVGFSISNMIQVLQYDCGLWVPLFTLNLLSCQGFAREQKWVMSQGHGIKVDGTNLLGNQPGFPW